MTDVKEDVTHMEWYMLFIGMLLGAVYTVGFAVWWARRTVRKRMRHFYHAIRWDPDGRIDYRETDAKVQGLQTKLLHYSKAYPKHTWELTEADLSRESDDYSCFTPGRPCRALRIVVGACNRFDLELIIIRRRFRREAVEALKHIGAIDFYCVACLSAECIAALSELFERIRT